MENNGWETRWLSALPFNCSSAVLNYPCITLHATEEVKSKSRKDDCLGAENLYSARYR